MSQNEEGSAPETTGDRAEEHTADQEQRSRNKRTVDEPTETEAARALDAFGLSGDDRITVCHQRPGAPFSFEPTTAAKAGAIAARIGAGSHVWVSRCPLRAGLLKARGDASDVIRLPSLWSDLDFKSLGPDPERTAREVIDRVSAVYGVDASIEVSSGGGLQPTWLIDPEDEAARFEPGSPEADRAASLLKRHGNLVGIVAREVCPGAQVDNVYDLPRIMRLPGTFNVKPEYGTPRRVTANYPGGAALSIEGAEDALDARGIPQERATTAPEEPPQPWGGPPYAEMPERARRRVDGHTSKVFERIKGDLLKGAALAEGEEDEKGHTWQMIVSLAGWQGGALATSWSGLSEGDVIERLMTLMPEEMKAAVFSGGRSVWDTLNAQVGRKDKEPGPGWLSEAITAPHLDGAMPDTQITSVPEAGDGDAFGSEVEREALEGHDGTDTEVPASWRPTDLAAILDGTYEPPTPALLPRDDGTCLLYASLVHSIHGESESGKSFVVQHEAARLIQREQSVVYIDFESDAPSVVGRLLTLGCAPAAILDHLTYIRPEASHTSNLAELEAFADLLTSRPALIIMDGVTDALGQAGLSTVDNDEVSAWFRHLPRRLARETGAAVVLIDHVTKNADTRGRFAIGGQAKMAALDGAAYTVDVIEPLGVGRVGRLSLRVGKDRPGGVRGRCGPPRKGDRTQEAAVIVIDSTAPGRTTVTVHAPEVEDAGITDRRRQSEMAGLMRQIIDEVTVHPGLSTTGIEKAVKGGSPKIRAAIRELIVDGYLATEDGPRNSILHRLGSKPFALDSEALPTVIFASGTASTSEDKVTSINTPGVLTTSASPYREGDAGRGHQPPRPAKAGRGGDAVGRCGGETAHHLEQSGVAGRFTYDPTTGHLVDPGTGEITGKQSERAS